MSSVVKAAKVARYVFAGIVILFVLFVISAYMQADSINKAYIEELASKTLGVPVTIGEMTVSIEKNLVRLKDIKIANPAGYRGPLAARADSAEINVASFDLKRVTFNLVTVKGLIIFLEMNPGSTNIHDLRRQAAQNVRNIKPNDIFKDVRVMVRTVTLEKPQLRPVVTLEPTKIGGLAAQDQFVRDIGTAENGITVPAALALVTDNIVTLMNLIANQAELFKGMNLETLNSMGISTYDVFKKNVNKKINNDLEEANKLFNSLYDDVSRGVNDVMSGSLNPDAPEGEESAEDVPE
ncbi:MAG: hypothetical protein KDI90_02690 [Alphaproteobacteria bacterium]|nr:hypothetical protein [Alphaproteobacteria bacterium]MCB9975394.1 hypothetical protein [Rhodospirillales bacterium]